MHIEVKQNKPISFTILDMCSYSNIYVEKYAIMQKYKDQVALTFAGLL